MYRCRKCKWEGEESELDYDVIDTCFGQDKTEMCPICGSVEINFISNIPSLP